MLSSLGSVLALLFLPIIFAADTFIGCISGGVPEGSSYYSSSSISPANCAAICSARPETLPGYSSAYATLGGFCQCLTVTPDPYRYSSSRQAPNADRCPINSDLSFYRLRTTFTFSGCYSYIAAGFQTQSINECFNTCRGETGVFVSPHYNEDDILASFFDCQCGSAETIPGALDGRRSCAPFGDSDEYGQISYFYSHPAGAAASQLVRRKRHIPAQPQYCPAGTTACKVQGAEESDSYECIDTMSELESCGGCVFGEYKPSRHGKHNASYTGINCSDGEDNMTCRAGRCVRAF